jgi:GTPase SAR1 family protein
MHSCAAWRSIRAPHTAPPLRSQAPAAMPFGQVVIGPPGSGKTTYCNGMQQYLTAVGRKVALVNLDPANDVLPYQPDVDIADLVCLDSVMQELHLGPNGGAGTHL